MVLHLFGLNSVNSVWLEHLLKFGLMIVIGTATMADNDKKKMENQQNSRTGCCKGLNVSRT
jgi:hypothetical protein